MTLSSLTQRQRKIAFFASDKTDACNYFRGKGALAFLDVALHQPDTDLCWESVIGQDLGFLLRPSSLTHFSLAEIITTQIPLLVDWDDDVPNLPLENPSYTHFKSKPIADGLSRTIAAAERVIVSTNALAESFSSTYGHPRIHVVPNAHNDLVLGTERNTLPRTKTVLWRGNETHIKDLSDYADAIAHVAGRHRDWTFVFMGAQPWVLSGRMPFTYASSKDLLTYFTWLGTKATHAVQIVPLSDNPFNHAKSAIAWLEASFAGAAVLAPDWEEWRKPGACLYRDPAHFAAKLEALIEDPAAVADSAAASWRYIQQNLLLSQVNPRRSEVLDLAIARVA